MVRDEGEITLNDAYLVGMETVSNSAQTLVVL